MLKFRFFRAVTVLMFAVGNINKLLKAKRRPRKTLRPKMEPVARIKTIAQSDVFIRITKITGPVVIIVCQMIAMVRP